MTTKNDLIKKLKDISKDTSKKLAEEFTSTPLQLRVAFASEVLRSYECLPKFSTASTKIVKKSLEYRRLGNQAYTAGKKNSDIVALKYYILSIAYARDDSEELAVAYANRSAVLCRQEKYRFALVDVNRALRGKLPEVVRQKLVERKKTCIREIKEDNAHELMLARMYSAHLDPFLQLVLCATLKKDLEFNVDEIENVYLKKPDIPTLSRKNPAFPNITAKINVGFDPEKKRQLIASTNIEPGEILVVEKPYAMILSPKHAFTHCARCFIRSLTLIPCNGCSKVMFCGQKCRAEALVSFHRVECQIMPTLLRLQLEDKEMLALRMVLIATKQGEDLKSFTNYSFFETNETKQPTSAKKKKPNMLNKKRNQKPIKTKREIRKRKHMYDKVNTLEDGLTVLSREEMVNELSYQSIIAAILLHVLKSSSYFTKTVQNGLAVQTIPEEIQQLVGNLLLKHLLVLDLNGERMVEWIERSRCVPYKMISIGEALYPTFSFMNHSCDPNVAKFTHQDCIVVRAVQPIAAGEEVVTCYGESFGINTREKRQEHCQKFHFKCNCDPCKFDWPLYRQLPNGNPIFLTDKIDRATLNKNTLRLTRMKAKLENIEHFDKFACEFLSMVHKSIKKPWKDYYDCLEMYRNFLISKANSYSPSSHPLLEFDIQ